MKWNLAAKCGDIREMYFVHKYIYMYLVYKYIDDIFDVLGSP